LSFTAIIAKLVKVQIIDHAEYSRIWRVNAENRHEIAARRGTILDRRDRVLAKDILQYSIALSANRIKNKGKVKAALKQHLNISSAYIDRKIKKNSRFTYLVHKVPANEVVAIKQLQDPGLILEERFLRVYPHQFYGAHVLGFCDVNNNPLGGVEFQYNKFLQGKSGWRIYEKDALGLQLPDLDIPGEDPIDGMDVKLSLDIDFQIVVDDELQNAVKSSKAVDGIAILMDPISGDILALSNYPNFDPAKPNRYHSSALKNRAITDVFEPGSTFKIVTLAAALEILHINLDRDIFFCENGKYRLFGHQFTDYKKYGWLTARRVFEHSSNIGVVKIAEKLKKEVLFNYARNFGFGVKSGVDLPGESVGILNPIKRFSKTSHLFMSFGYEIGVTPIQLISAYAVLANGGKLMKPKVMLAIQEKDRRVVKKNQTEIIRRVISQEASDLMTGVLLGVVKNGTGKEAYLKNLEVAGKTGTAQLYDIEKGTYDSRKHLASFVGYFPAYTPRFVLLVMIRQPQGEYYGGQVAAPVFKNIAQRIMGLQPADQVVFAESMKKNKNQSLPAPPTVIGLERQRAENLLVDAGYKIKVHGTGNFVAQQKEILEGGKLIGVKLFVEDLNQEPLTVMPALTGMSLREALNLLSNIDISVDVDGHGTVISQQPKAGSRIFNKKPVKLRCKPS
jgi:cell division protein FtsI/penicillin-binding protein 2